jgi:hypothetical protein
MILQAPRRTAGGITVGDKWAFMTVLTALDGAKLINTSSREEESPAPLTPRKSE